MNTDEDIEKISVIVPIYNQEKNIIQCVNSIIAAALPEMQVILVDDGSTDDTWNIISNYNEQHGFKIIHQENCGVSVARNKGLECATGKWIAFIDPDDCIEAEYFSRLLMQAESEEGIDIVSCAYKVFNDNYENDEFFFEQNFITNGEDDKIKLYLQLLVSSYGRTVKGHTAIGVPWGKLYRRSLLLKNNIKFNPKLRRMQDNAFNMYAFDCACRIKYFNECLYRYRLDHISGFGAKYHSYFLSNQIELFNERENFFMKQHSFFNNEEIVEAYNREIINQTYRAINNYSITEGKPTSSERRRQFEALMENSVVRCAIAYFDGHGSRESSRKFQLKVNVLRTNSYLKSYYLCIINNKIKGVRN